MSRTGGLYLSRWLLLALGGMDAPQDSWPEQPPTDAEIRAQLRDLLARDYDEALLPPLDENLPREQRAPCPYSRFLRRDGIRQEVLVFWKSSSMRSCQDAAAIERDADRLARSLIRYLRGWRVKLAEQAAEYKAQIEQILVSENPEQLLAPNVFPKRFDSPPDPCSISPLLREDSVRLVILAACKELTPQERRNVEKRRRVANRLLRLAMSCYGSRLDLAAIAHYTTVSDDRSAMQALRQKSVRDLLGAERIPVEALQNCLCDRKVQPKGALFDVDALVFLEQAHHDAMTIGASPGPIFNATTRKHAAMKAATCWRILEFLGRQKRNRANRRSSISVSLNAVVAEIAGRKGGKRYAQIKTLAQGLHRLGLIRIRKMEDQHRIALVRKKVKYLRDIPRRWETLHSEST